MKRTVLVMSMVAILFTAGMSVARAQEQPQPKKDTVNMDTNAKPEFYYPVEDEASGSKKGAFPVIPVVAGVVVVGGIGAFFALRKKK
jgi:hypothetical protein